MRKTLIRYSLDIFTDKLSIRCITIFLYLEFKMIGDTFVSSLHSDTPSPGGLYQQAIHTGKQLFHTVLCSTVVARRGVVAFDETKVSTGAWTDRSPWQAFHDR